MSASERIYLQWFEGDTAYMPEGVTWCDDRIEDDDVEYVRADKAAAEIETLRNEIERLRAVIDRLMLKDM
jgi:hypothetical protein